MRATVIGVILGWCLPGTVFAVEPVARPNVLLIVSDDLNTHVSTSG